GGPAEWLFKPEDTQDLAAFFALLPAEVPVTVLGVGSNLIVRDGGIRGVVVKLGRGFADIGAVSLQSPVASRQEEDIICAGAGALDVNVAHVAAEAGLAGFEFLSGIPGTIGGAVRMNGGAYGSDMAQVLVKAEVVHRHGGVSYVMNERLGFSYRHSNLQDGDVVTRAWMRGSKGDKAEIQARMAQIQQSREDTQPIRSRTGGSTFKNPEGHKAWELVDRAGCRGLTMGGAQVSEKHCNFLINTGNATAADLEALGEEVRRRVKEATGVQLEWEIKRIGERS
ncbi:MAG: UDP-N-acetylmuramate dehydrogenase, partial [Rickettsiales bacterium]|nr:UDP-N-acetylmuramate dehydrogenase [Rickettsiales bacterium]